jgi:hypothetical protein
MEAKKNTDGSFEVVLGNSGVRNKNGLVFPTEQLRNEIVKLNVRAKQGTALAEVGFPQRRPGEDPDNFRRRFTTVDLERVCARFTDFRVENDNPADPRIVAIVQPAGPFANVARDHLEAGGEGVYFGARFYADGQMEDNKPKLALRNFITFDLVAEQP